MVGIVVLEVFCVQRGSLLGLSLIWEGGDLKGPASSLAVLSLSKLTLKMRVSAMAAHLTPSISEEGAPAMQQKRSAGSGFTWIFRCSNLFWIWLDF